MSFQFLMSCFLLFVLSAVQLHLQPMPVVDGVGFQELMAVAGLHYTIPSHTFFSQTMLPAKYAELFAKVQSVLTIVPYCFITTDVVIQISVKRICYCHMSCD